MHAKFGESWLTFEKYVACKSWLKLEENFDKFWPIF